MRYLCRKKEPSGASGFSMIEVIVTVFIIAAGFLLLYTVFSLHVRHSLLSRNRITAELIADSVIEEIKAHPYGDPAPDSWKKPVITYAVIQGHRIMTTYKKDIQCTYNGSFVGKVPGYTDMVTVKLTWTEGTGTEGSGKTRTYKETIPVRRDF